jgi:hypothetical protein
MKTKYKSALVKWLPVFLWAAVIFTFSSIPQIKISEFFIWDFIAKKIAHVSEYAILYALIFRATKGNYLASFILTMLYAVSDEFHQSFVPGRTARFFDLGFDLTGANIAAYIIWKLQPRWTWLKQILPAKPKK